MIDPSTLPDPAAAAAIIPINWVYIGQVVIVYGAVGAFSMAFIEWLKTLFDIPEQYKGWAYPLLSLGVITFTIAGLHAITPETVWGWALVRQMTVGTIGTWITTTGIIKRGNRKADRAAGGDINKQNV